MGKGITTLFYFYVDIYTFSQQELYCRYMFVLESLEKEGLAVYCMHVELCKRECTSFGNFDNKEDKMVFAES